MPLRETQGRVTRLRQTTEWVQAHTLSIGYQGASGQRRYEDGSTVAGVALLNEFGTDDTPERSFIRAVLREQRQAISSLWATELGKAYQFRLTALEAYRAVGSAIVEMIQRKIDEAAAWAAPNTLATLAAKGLGKRPLEDTGMMRDSLSWAIRRGGAIVEQGGV